MAGVPWFSCLKTKSNTRHRFKERVLKCCRSKYGIGRNGPNIVSDVFVLKELCFGRVYSVNMWITGYLRHS